MNLKVFTIFTLLLLSSYKCCAWYNVVCHVGSWFGQGAAEGASALPGQLRDVGNELIVKAQGAFKDSMDDVFVRHITPMMNQLDMTAQRILQTAGGVAERVSEKIKNDFLQIVDELDKKITELINNVLKKITTMINDTIENIKTNILKFTFDFLSDFERKITADINDFLNKVDEMINKVSCISQGTIARVENDFKNLLPGIPNPFEKCRAELDNLFPGQFMKFKFTSSFTETQLYFYITCDLKSKINEKSKMEAVRMIYVDLLSRAADMRCLMVARGIDCSKYLVEMANYSRIISTIDNLNK